MTQYDKIRLVSFRLYGNASEFTEQEMHLLTEQLLGAHEMSDIDASNTL
jgi:hypothetical protein